MRNFELITAAEIHEDYFKSACEFRQVRDRMTYLPNFPKAKKIMGKRYWLREDIEKFILSQNEK